ncbi:MAG: hypothetical protein GW859_05945 [Sphingomonadales bacterium]|nr:hypothetical protein [Sphingomonadales bacterium]
MAFTLTPNIALSMIALSGALGLAVQVQALSPPQADPEAASETPRAWDDDARLRADSDRIAAAAARAHAEAMRIALDDIDDIDDIGEIEIDHDAIAQSLRAARRDIARMTIDKAALKAQIARAIAEADGARIDHRALSAEIAASVREGLAAGADGMESGADGMLRGADEMEAYAARLRDPAFRRSEVARINAEEGGRWKRGKREAVTEQELVDAIPKLEAGAVKMRKGAEKMRDGAARMREKRSD